MIMSGGAGEERERERGPYGFVNMMSDAPSVQRVRCECRYVRAGRIPHVRGSSSLEELTYLSLAAVCVRASSSSSGGSTRNKKKRRTSRDG